MSFFFFNDPATTEIYTLSLHDALPIFARVIAEYRATLPKFFKRYQVQPVWRADRPQKGRFREFYQCDVDAIGSRSMIVEAEDRKSTRLNSSHSQISYAVFCLKKKKKKT